MANVAKYIVGAKHQAFGVEGDRAFAGSENEALAESARIARAAGHGWQPLTLEVLASGEEIPVVDPDEQCPEHGCARHRCDADHEVQS